MILIHFYQIANLSDIISERGACGVGFIANLRNEPSHKIVKDALIALGCMEHRGGCGADNDSGDGSGVMSSIPWDLYNNWAKQQGLPSFDTAKTGVGMVFLPRDENLMNEAKEGNVWLLFLSDLKNMLIHGLNLLWYHIVWVSMEILLIV
jgi:glutamate synthase (ferredoxin)